MQGYSGKTQVKVWAWALVEAMPWCCCQSANSPCWRSLNMFERRISQQSVSCGLVSKMAVLAHSRLAVYDYFSQCHCKQHHFHGRQLLYSAVASQRRDADAGSGLSCAVPTDWHWQPYSTLFHLEDLEEVLVSSRHLGWAPQQSAPSKPGAAEICRTT